MHQLTREAVFVVHRFLAHHVPLPRVHEGELERPFAMPAQGIQHLMVGRSTWTRCQLSRGSVGAVWQNHLDQEHSLTQTVYAAVCEVVARDATNVPDDW